MITIKVGGSCLFDESGELRLHVIREIACAVNEISRHEKVVVIVGGGKPARKYIQWARALGANMGECDILGINVARLNARLMAVSLEDVYPRPAENVEDVMQFLATGKVVVAGGFQPGQSTNMVSAVIAERTGSRALINVISVGGVYDSDPVANPDARRIDVISVEDLMKLVIKLSQKPGKYPLFDLPALSVIRRSGIPVWFVSPNKEEILKAAHGEKVGTMVHP